MKLVKILARELKKWPADTDFMVQDDSGRTWPSSRCTPQTNTDGNWNTHISCIDFMATPASDCRTAVVTREIWEAARAKLAKKLSRKCGAWAENTTGKRPVKKKTLVEVLLRNGDHLTASAGILDWSIERNSSDITRYRVVHGEQP